MIIICFNEDGDLPTVEELTREEFLKDLNTDKWGENPAFTPSANISVNRFVGLMVIDGEIVQPRPKTTVKTWDV